MVEVEVDPLTDIQLVLVVAKADSFDEVVCSLTDSHDLICAHYSVKTALTACKGQIDDMNE